MVTWDEFVGVASRIAETFVRRHTATSNLCMLATLRSDGFPRISPMEPRFFEDQLRLVGMPHTTKFVDLQRDQKFCLHTGTVDSGAADGDARLFGRVQNVPDERLHRRFTEYLLAQTGFDIRDRQFKYFYAADITELFASPVPIFIMCRRSRASFHRLESGEMTSRATDVLALAEVLDSLEPLRRPLVRVDTHEHETCRRRRHPKLSASATRRVAGVAHIARSQRSEPHL